MSDLDTHDVVGTKEAAAILAVRPTNFVRDWATRPDFPKPVVALGRRRLWDRQDVLAYRRNVGRRRAQPTRGLGISGDAARLLPAIKRRIVRGFDPERIMLFGSHARGDATADSDLDLLVIVADGRDLRGLTSQIRARLADIDIAKDVFVTTPAFVERYGDVIGSLLEPALREGLTVYAKA